MSSLCLDMLRGDVSRASFAVVLFAATFFSEAFAADTYFEPKVSAGAEYNTNRNLAVDSNLEESMPGYLGTLEFTWGRQSETNETILRPRLRFQRYPDRKDLQRTEQFLDFRSTGSTQRSEYGLFANYSRRDTFNSELADVVFDDLTSEDAPVPESGEVIGGKVHTRYHLRPSYRYKVTENTGIGVHVSGSASRFDEELRDRNADYDYMLASATLTHSFTPRNSLLLGPYVSRFETKDDLHRNDSAGLELGWSSALSSRLRMRFSLIVENSDSELRDATTRDVTVNESSTDYGPELRFRRNGEVDSFRFTIGRRFTPTSRGGKAVIDQLRLQYDRDLRDRLSMVIALRAYQSTSQTSFAGGADYDFVGGKIALRWQLSRKFFLVSGYDYNWRDLENESGSAKNHAVFIEFGFVGLGPQS